MQISVVFFLMILAGSATKATANLKRFPAILIFGDSTMDTGNNNYIKTVVKANHLPYGEDFPGKTPTGRFSNGKLIADFVASKLRIKETVPPFLDPTLSDHDIVTGVTFASAGSGFDHLTTTVTNVIPVQEQADLFRRYKRRLQGVVGEEKAENIINDALVIVSAGTNDFVLNFYDLPTRGLEFNITGYQSFLLHKLQNFLKELYEHGCRTIIVPGLSPVGCLPIQMSVKFKHPKNGKCLKDENSDAQSFNWRLRKVLSQTQEELPGSRILYADIYELMMSIINNPGKHGLVETKRGCCGTGELEVSFLCSPLTPTCRNHSQFLFWDSIHPTESAYQYFADVMYEQILRKLLAE